jgi:hypothetical protein
MKRAARKFVLPLLFTAAFAIAQTSTQPAGQTSTQSPDQISPQPSDQTATQSSDHNAQQAKITKVETHQIMDPHYVPPGPAGKTPLTSKFYRHRIEARVGCTDYVADYDDQLDLLPSQIAEGGTVPVAVDEHKLVFDTASRKVEATVRSKQEAKDCKPSGGAQ